MSADPNGPHETRIAARSAGLGAGAAAPAPKADTRAPAERQPQQKRGLNENYGRELMELHTLGVDGG